MFTEGVCRVTAGQRGLRCFSRAASALIFLGLAGCTSFLQGEQYRFPAAGEPSATVRLAYAPHTELHAMSFSESGCYSGWTALPGHDGYIDSPVAAGKELVLTYHRAIGGQACKIPFSFTPEAGATYTFVTGSWSKPGKGLLPIFNVDQQFCGLSAVKKIGDQESVEPIKQLRIKTGFACLKFVE